MRLSDGDCGERVISSYAGEEEKRGKPKMNNAGNSRLNFWSALRRSGGRERFIDMYNMDENCGKHSPMRLHSQTPRMYSSYRLLVIDSKDFTPAVNAY